MNRADLPFQTVAALSELIRRGEISPVEATEAYLERIDALNGDLRAYLTVTPELARPAARAAADEIARGQYRGPLHGIPVAVKDQMYTAGVRTTGGSPVFNDFTPDYDATVVARLKQAGAVLLGKLNMTEFATTGLSHQFDPPRNPWRRDLSSGGSSSGSGAATAAFMCAAALGEDTGGSVRFPAAWCGLAGLRPTWGLVSRYGVMPGVRSMDTVGPLSRTVEDCALMLQAIAGPDPQDRLTRQEAPPDYRAALTGDVRGLRCGILREVLDAPSVDADTRQSILDAANVLAGLGAEVQEVSAPLAAHAGAINGGIRLEAPTTYRELLRQRPQAIAHDNRIGYLTNAIMPAAHYYKAIQLRTLLRRPNPPDPGKRRPPPIPHRRRPGPAAVPRPDNHRQAQRQPHPLAANRRPQPRQPPRPGRPLRLQRRRPPLKPTNSRPPLRRTHRPTRRPRLRTVHQLAHPPPAGVGGRRIGWSKSKSIACIRAPSGL